MSLSQQLKHPTMKTLNDPTIQTKSYRTILKSFYNNKKILLILPLLINDKFVTYKNKSKHV